MPPLPVPTLGPNLTATLNALSTLLLIVGWVAIRRKHSRGHKRFMLGALTTSALFLVVYLTHHAISGSTRYPFRDWTYTLYLLVLIPHTVLATAILPFVLRGVWLAWRERFDRHARLMRWVWPAWLYVSVTGIVVYGMLYWWPHWRAGL